MPSDVEQVIAIVTGVFDALGIGYMIGGSVASGVHGVYRFTIDIDIVADIPEDKIQPLADALTGLYADEKMIRDGVEAKSSFSIIQLAYMGKLDVFLKSDDAWANEVWRRRMLLPIATDGGLTAYLASVEDAMLQKLRRFQMGGGVSDRQ